MSSDAVFSGARTQYDETCLPDPLTPYGGRRSSLGRRYSSLHLNVSMPRGCPASASVSSSWSHRCPTRQWHS
ncbi:hypothetical protein [Streptomyces echinatus]|uniref:hypothetical protein n=1 Tax=Streptomyces echinatus TaxID=67293 RepID=UPI003CD0556B